MLPCETWSKEAQAGFYAKFSCQAYDNPDPSNRVEFITRSSYRLDLDTQRIILLRSHPTDNRDLEIPPAHLSGTWSPANERLMTVRMLNKAPLPFWLRPDKAGPLVTENSSPIPNKEPERAAPAALAPGATKPAPTPPHLESRDASTTSPASQTLTVKGPLGAQGKALPPTPNQEVAMATSSPAAQPLERSTFSLDQAEERILVEQTIRYQTRLLEEAKKAYGEALEMAYPEPMARLKYRSSHKFLADLHPQLLSQSPLVPPQIEDPSLPRRGLTPPLAPQNPRNSQDARPPPEYSSQALGQDPDPRSTGRRESRDDQFNQPPPGMIP